MSVIKSVPVNGSQSSFVPLSENEQVAVDFSQDSQPSAQMLLDNLTLEARQELGQEYLASLSEQERKTILLQSFENDLQQFKDTAIQEGKELGFTNAKENAEQQFEQQIEGVKAELKQVMTQWLDLVKQDEQQTQWTIAEPENYLLLVTKALGKLLPINLLKPLYVDEFVSDMVARFGKHSPKTLFLPQAQFEQFMEVMNDKELAFEVKPDSTLDIGSYRLALQSGDIHYHLQEVFEQFVRELQSQAESTMENQYQGDTQEGEKSG